jgi:hypothetical protein
MSADMRLDGHRGQVRIYPGRKEQARHLPCLALEHCGILPDSDRMKLNDAKDVVEGCL